MGAVFQSQNPVLSQYIRNAMLSALITRPGAQVWQNPEVALTVQVGFNPGPKDTLASYITNEANFTGYARQVPVAVVPVNRGNNVQALIASVVFEATTSGTFVGNNLTGYWCDDRTNVVAAEAFLAAGPIVISSPNDYCQIDLIIPLDTPQAA